jgi:hypothetical protein
MCSASAEGISQDLGALEALMIDSPDLESLEAFVG